MPPSFTFGLWAQTSYEPKGSPRATAKSTEHCNGAILLTGGIPFANALEFRAGTLAVVGLLCARHFLVQVTVSPYRVCLHSRESEAVVKVKQSLVA